MTSNAYNTGKIFDGYMGRNRINNGACTVVQRSTATFTAGTFGYGGPDRFNANNNAGTGGTFTQSVGTFTYGGVARAAVVQTATLAMTTTTGTAIWNGIGQTIEGYNAYDLVNQNISVSFLFNTNVTGTYAMSIRDGAGTNTYITTFAATANTPAKYTFLIPANASLSIPNTNAAGILFAVGSINTGTFATSTLNAWQTGNFLSTSTATNWGSVASNFIAVAELQLEEGAIVTPFEREPVQVTFAKCERYYQIRQGTLLSPGGGGGSFGGGIVNVFLTAQRTTSPTLVATNINTSGGYAGAISAAISGSQTTSSSVIAWFTTNPTAGQFCTFQVTVSADF